jgi:hypothetical protein
MNVYQKHIATTMRAILIATTLITVGAMEVEAKKFDRGYINPNRAAKARSTPSASNGSANGWTGKTIKSRRDRVVNITADWNGDLRDTVGIRNRTRTQSNQMQIQRTIRNRNQKLSILPYIEQDNLYR